MKMIKKYNVFKIEGILSQLNKKILLNTKSKGKSISKNNVQEKN